TRRSSDLDKFSVPPLDDAVRTGMNTTASRLQISVLPWCCAPTMCTGQHSPACARRWRNKPGLLAPGVLRLGGGLKAWMPTIGAGCREPERSLPMRDVAGLNFHRQGGVATVRLNRPERLNAITWKMVEGLIDFTEECSRDDTIRVIVITGNGRAFSSGDDIVEGM